MNEQDSALFKAVRSRRLAEVKRLVEAGANVNARKADGNVPLHHTYNVDIAEYLVKKGADVNVVGAYRATPLHCAAFKGIYDVVSLLIEKGANVNSRGPGGSTPLLFAAEMSSARVKNAKYLEVVKLLVENGADVNLANEKGMKPIDFAENRLVASYLRKAGAKEQEKCK